MTQHIRCMFKLNVCKPYLCLGFQSLVAVARSSGGFCCKAFLYNLHGALESRIFKVTSLWCCESILAVVAAIRVDDANFPQAGCSYR